MIKKSDAPKARRGRPKTPAKRILHKKMFLIDDATNEILRNVCYEHRIKFSELIRNMIEVMIEKRWKYFDANYRGL